MEIRNLTAKEKELVNTITYQMHGFKNSGNSEILMQVISTAKQLYNVSLGATIIENDRMLREKEKEGRKL